jgi:hypothetical protein
MQGLNNEAATGGRKASDPRQGADRIWQFERYNDLGSPSNPRETLGLEPDGTVGTHDPNCAVVGWQTALLSLCARGTRHRCLFGLSIHPTFAFMC